ncbi:unnamed protein product [Periconia digitata]|uniref:Uncharacterized protein n=1 Tax=Periconia digitata TaxID=1303443 RepID=A0A9W4XUJ3_9PLEO|nr:unnamed protein product [Periconia digitata]
MNQELDLADLPSYAHLNRAQKRAFILRDKLKFLDPHHLDTFIAGIESPEPPNYRNINGKTEPAFEEVTLTKDAKRLDLGNVRFHERDRTFIKRSYLVIDAGNCELKETKALPQDEGNLLCVPIEAYSVESTVPLFLAKYQAIEARRHQINEVRRSAFSGAEKFEPQINRGKSLSKLHSESYEADGSVFKPRPRAAGDPIPRHAANKRKRIGLPGIPDAIKSEALGSIPDHTRVILFDMIMKNAFPHFDNLMMASWNVVSLFSGTGTEENELLRAIAQLDAVLREFDDYYAIPKKMKRSSVEENGSGAKDRDMLAPANPVNSRSGSSRISADLSTPSAAPQSLPSGSKSAGRRSKQPHPFQIEDDDDEEEDVVSGSEPPFGSRRASRGKHHHQSSFPPPSPRQSQPHPSYYSPREPPTPRNPYAQNPSERSSSSSAYPPFLPPNDPNYPSYPFHHSPSMNSPYQNHPFNPYAYPPPPPSHMPPPFSHPKNPHIQRKFTQPSPSSRQSTPPRTASLARPLSQQQQQQRQIYTDGNSDEPLRSRSISHISPARPPKPLRTAEKGDNKEDESGTKTHSKTLDEEFAELDDLFNSRPSSRDNGNRKDEEKQGFRDGEAAGDEMDVDRRPSPITSGGGAGGNAQEKPVSMPTQGVYLGRSSLGAKKSKGGVAPVADMFGNFSGGGAIGTTQGGVTKGKDSDAGVGAGRGGGEASGEESEEM